MITYLFLRKEPLFLLLFHISLGLISAISKIPIIIYFYLILFSAVPHLLKIKKDFSSLNFLLVYIIPFELLCRMTETSPFIPYEFSKYLMFLLLSFGILKGVNRGKIGFVMLALILPSLFFDLSDQVDFKGLVFNLLAPINLCLSIVYFSRNPITKDQFHFLLRAMFFPLLAALAFVFIRTPSFDTIEFTLGAIHDTTGGFGPNQVATVFGLGLFLTFYLINRNVKVSGSILIDIAILFLFGFQGLLSFSRGGMIGGLFAIIIYYLFTSSRKFKNKISSRNVLPVLVILLGSFWMANEITDGQLVLRYSGETAGTQSGAKEKDLNSITTGRVSIFEGDWSLFQENAFGVGVGASMYMRKIQNGVATHTELSRLVAEHGYLGLIFFVILTLIPFFYFNKSYSTEWKGLMIALYFLSWYTSFHAATRNFVTPLLIGIALMHIQPEKLETISNKITT